MSLDRHGNYDLLVSGGIKPQYSNSTLTKFK